MLQFYHIMRKRIKGNFGDKYIIFRSLTGNSGRNIGTVEDKLGVKMRQLILCANT